MYFLTAHLSTYKKHNIMIQIIIGCICYTITIIWLMDMTNINLNFILKNLILIIVLIDIIFIISDLKISMLNDRIINAYNSIEYYSDEYYNHTSYIYGPGVDYFDEIKFCHDAALSNPDDINSPFIIK